MKIECRKENLIHSISLAEKATGKNLTLPVLGCVLLEVYDNDFLKIRATNLELGIEIKIKSKVLDKGKVIVPGNILYNVINSITENSKITLELNESNLLIKTNNNETLIKSIQSNDFPTLPKISKEDKKLKINTKDFLRGIQSVWYSASNTTIKPELSSVYIYSYDRKIFFVATDSFRLAEKVIIPKKSINFDQILIPINNIPKIIKVFEYLGDQDINIFLNKNQISFETEELYLISRLIDSEFPDYKQIVPNKYSTEVILLKQDFLNILKRTGIFINKSNQIKFFVHPKEKSFILKSHNQDIGETTELIESTTKGEDIEINFNFRYILDCLQIINSDSISLSFSGIGKPMIIKGISDNTFMYLVMPMNK